MYATKTTAMLGTMALALGLAVRAAGANGFAEAFSWAAYDPGSMGVGFRTKPISPTDPTSSCR